jgi:hypothetical protein
MLTWLFDSSTPAWLQAVGSVLAILIAVWVPSRQRLNSLQDAQAERKRQDREHRRHLTVGLRAEIDAALEAADRQQFAIDRALERLQEARAMGAEIEASPIQPGSMVTTDAVVYRQIASELGQLPPELIRSVVLFYSLALDLGRLADGAPTAQLAYETIQSLLPRFKMHAALLIRTLDKFEASGFTLDADIQLKPEEFRELAAKVDYPLDQVIKERGLAP